MKKFSWNPLTWKTYFSTEAQTRSWIGHGVATILVGLVGGLVAWIWISPLLGYVIFTTLTALYYIRIREPLDLLMHMREGHEDVSYEGDAGPIHYKIDRVGDSVAPGAVAGSAWIAFLLSLL